jgi:hypothetical protein
MRRTFTILSLITASVGFWLILRVHPLADACTLSSPLTGTGVSASCMQMMTIYFMGFAVAVLGLMGLMLTLLSMVKHQRRRGDYLPNLQPIAVRKIGVDDEKLRKVA